jgi:hypothetical protein
MVDEVAPRDLLLDQRLHLAQALEHAEVEIAAVDERPHRLAVEPGVGLGARHGARLDPGIALPVPPVLQQVVLEGREAAGERPRIAEGTQPHIDTEHEAVRRDGRQQPDQRLPEPQEELLVADGRRVLRLAVTREQEHEIDVGREVELAAAELAHRHHHERHRLAVREHRLAVACAGERRGLPQRERDGIVREGREVLERLLQRGEAGQVAPRDAHHLAAAPAPQPRLPLGLGRRGVGRTPLRPAGLTAGRTQVRQGVAAREVRPQQRIPREGLGDEVAAGEGVLCSGAQGFREIFRSHAGSRRGGGGSAQGYKKSPARGGASW